MYDRLLADSPKATVPTSLAWKFKYSIDKQQPFSWILDGHNVLFSLTDIFGCDDSGVPGEDARNKLIATLLKYLALEHPEMPIDQAMKLINKFIRINNESN